MVHFTCDRCGRLLSGQRFIVKLEVAPAPENVELTVADLDADHLEQVGELLDSLDLDEAAAGLDPLTAHHRQYDLCLSCREVLLRDPLNSGSQRQLKFSGN